MHTGGFMKQAARWMALGALFLIPFTPLVVTSSLFFPFITGKAFFFRILVEIAVAGWVVLAFLDKEYRPRFSWIGVLVTSFVVWMFIADALAINAAKAFWSNFERMEGWVLLVHLLGFFLASSSVLRAEKKWRAWFLTSLGVAVCISVYALLQLAGAFAIHQGSSRIDASLGNSAYLAIYLLFNVCIAFWLALTEQYAWLKWSLLTFSALEAVLIFFTETRGTVLGLIGALILGAFLFSMVTGSVRTRRYSIVFLIFIVAIAGTCYAFRDSSFIQNNHVLQRVSSISSEDGATRFTIWSMALKGALERPVFGWGQEGFNYVFNKYYDPSLYYQEPWFDRAHNAFIDWLTAGGIPAFLLYLSLFGSALLLLWKSPGLSLPERIALTAALAGYAFHNMFVFDNLYSYVYFFAILALIDSQVAQPFSALERAPVLSEEEGLVILFPVISVFTIALIWYVNVSGIQVAGKLISALSPSSSGVSGNIKIFRELTDHPSFAIQEIREQLVSFASSALQSTQVTTDQKQQIAALAVEQMQKQVDAYPLDARERLQLAYLYRSAGDEDNALKQTKIAAELSPKKEDILIQVGAIEWDRGNVKAAQERFRAAYALGPQFPELVQYAAAGDIAAGDKDAADKLLTDFYGTTMVDSDTIAVAYYRTKDWPSLISLWTFRTKKADATAQTWFSLAAVYYAAGDNANAIQAVTTAMERFPDAATAGEQALKQIREGK